MEIDYPDGSSVNVSMNFIPENVIHGSCSKDFNASKFFSPCIGKRLLGIDVKANSEMPDFSECYGMSLDINAKDYIEYFDLLLEDDIKIRFKSDYGAYDVILLDKNDAQLRLLSGNWMIA